MSEVSSRDWSEVTNVVGGDLGTHSGGRKYSPATLSSAFGITFRMMFKEEWRQNIDFAKKRHILAGHAWDSLLAATMADAVRSLARGLGPPARAHAER